jgi:mannan endo-1,4-beta-mannosidase
MRSAVGPLFLILALQQLGASAAAIAAPSSEPTPAVIAATAADSGSASASSSFSSAASLLAYINALSGQSKYILSGQHTGYWDRDPMSIVTPIPAGSGGKQVAILGLTNSWTATAATDFGTAPQSFVQYANGWLAKGGIVLVSQSSVSPMASGEPFSDLIKPGTPAYAKWYSYLDAQIAKFKQIKGPVIWRPFIEINGGAANWWGGAMSPSVFVPFYQQTHDYVLSKGVTNIVWLFSLNYWDPSGGLAWYPGSAYADLVGIDSYPPGPNDVPVYKALLTTGKPIMYAEAGVHDSDNSKVSQHSYDNSTILATVKASFPKAIAIVLWCQNYALPLQNGESVFMNDPAIITLGDLPANVATKRQPG